MRIGEVARLAGCTVETVRYYEREGLLARPARGANNYRQYGRPHLEALCFIRNCRVLEMSLEEIRTLINLKLDREKDCGEVNAILEEHIAHVSERIDRLEVLKAQLLSLRNLCGHVQPRKACAILLELAEPSQTGSPAREESTTHVRGPHERNP